MRRLECAGLGRVYGFTLRQQLKDRANLASLAILMVVCLLSMPVMALTGGGASISGISFVQPELTAVVLDNQTSLPLQPDWSGTAYEGVAVSEEPVETLAPKAVRITLRQEPEAYYLTVTGGDEVSEQVVTELAEIANGWIQAARAAALGVTEAAVQSLHSGVHTAVGPIDVVMQNDEANMEQRFMVTYVYGVLVLILCTYAATYIVRIVVEEKASRLVELLMVSVHPMALMLGKILAMMTFIFGMFAAMGVSLGLSWVLTRALGWGEAVAAAANLAALGGLRLDAGTVVIVLVSLLLAYGGFSLLAGLAGAGCSRNEDVEAATSSVMFAVLAGYLVSCFTAAMPGGRLSLVLTLCPVVNVFCAPVQYVCGNVSLVWLLVSWVEQALLVVALAVLTARVYRQLILTRGDRIKWRQLLAMAREVSR